MPRVLAIGLDAGSWPLIDSLLATGALPTLAALRQRGLWGALHQERAYRAELAWTEFLYGTRHPQGYWGTVSFDPSSYTIHELGAVDAAAVPPFYAGPRAPRTVSFDVPHAGIAHGVEGVQLVAWGAHSPQHGPASAPPELYEALVQRYGGHPAARSDSQPGWHHDGYQAGLTAALVAGAGRRAEALEWLLGQEPEWELALTVFSEPHSAGHLLWHGHDTSHPLAAVAPPGATARLESVYRAVDTAIGRLIAAVGASGPDGPPTSVVVFAVHDTVPNCSDVLATFVVPELLAAAAGVGRRLANPARRRGQSGPLVPRGDAPLASMVARSGVSLRCRVASRWRGQAPWWEIDERPLTGSAVDHNGGHDAGERVEREPFGYQPATWYRPDWPAMDAFALPSFSDAQVRLNLVGRERAGRVALNDYEQRLDSLERLLGACRDLRTGREVFAGFQRARQADPLSAGGPPADLIAFANQTPVDGVAHPDWGAFGPFPYLRTGEHGTAGFVLAVPSAGSRLGAGRAGVEEWGALPTCPADVGPWLCRLTGHSG